MELGGNIFLENFEQIESGKLIVVKKVVGNYTKNISEKAKGFKKIIIGLGKSEGYEINVKLEADEIVEDSLKDKNLFFALDGALAKVLSRIS